MESSLHQVRVGFPSVCVVGNVRAGGGDLTNGDMLWKAWLFDLSPDGILGLQVQFGAFPEFPVWIPSEMPSSRAAAWVWGPNQLPNCPHPFIIHTDGCPEPWFEGNRATGS